MTSMSSSIFVWNLVAFTQKKSTNLDERRLVLLLFRTDGLVFQQEFHDGAGGFGYGSTGAKDTGYTSLVQVVVVLGGDDTTGDDQDVFAAQLLELFNDLGYQGFVTGGQGRDTQHVDVVFNGLLGGFGRGLEQGTHVDVETAVGVASGYNLGAAVVTVLTHFCNHDTGLTAFLFGKAINQRASFLKVCVVLGF